MRSGVGVEGEEGSLRGRDGGVKERYKKEGEERASEGALEVECSCCSFCFFYSLLYLEIEFKF